MIPETPRQPAEAGDVEGTPRGLPSDLPSYTPDDPPVKLTGFAESDIRDFNAMIALLSPRARRRLGAAQFRLIMALALARPGVGLSAEETADELVGYSPLIAALASYRVIADGFAEFRPRFNGVTGEVSMRLHPIPRPGDDGGDWHG